MNQPFVLATAGHVDHGKSALVQALTGTDTDRLPEEKARGITIDLGFAHLRLPNPSRSTEPSRPPSPVTPTEFSCGIVDVPGHEAFVKNMVAGVGAIDLALFVVAADDGWMPQSEEHLQILLYLGVSRAVVALAKIDLVQDEPAAIASVRSRLVGTPFADAPIVPTSIPRQRGLDELRQALGQVLATTPPPSDFGKPRLPVDRVFVLKGIGTVVTGTLTGGTLARGEPVVLRPSGKTTRIRSCQSHGLEVERLPPGTRTALNLVDLAAADVRRGDVVTRESLGLPTRTLDVRLEKSERLRHTSHPAARPLESDTLVRLHLGSTNVPARLRLLDARSLVPGTDALAQLRLEAPVFAFAGDRFLVRDASEQATLAGGIVLDPDGPRSHARDAGRLERLRACALAPRLPDPFVEATLYRTRLTSLLTLLTQSRFSARQIGAAVGRIVAEGRAVLAGNTLAASDFWNERLARASRIVDTHHLEHPEQPGLPRVDLEAALRRHFGDVRGFDDLLVAMEREGFRADAHRVRRASHRPSLPEPLRAAGQRLRDQLDRRPLDPPSRRELAPDDVGRQALRYLLQTTEVVELGPEVVLSADAYALACRRIVAYLRRRGRATAGELRQMLDMHRRVLIPLLERLDRDGITQRDGDCRILRPTRPPHRPPAPGTAPL